MPLATNNSDRSCKLPVTFQSRSAPGSSAFQKPTVFSCLYVISEDVGIVLDFFKLKKIIRLIFSHCSFIFAMISAGTFSASQDGMPIGIFFLIYDRILPKIQCHLFLVPASPLSRFFTFSIVSC